MANTERARKLLVRSMVATGATVTTLFGAQNLAALDLVETDTTEILETEVLVLPEVQATQELLPTATQLLPTPEPTIIHSAPSITILRQPGQTSDRTVVNTSQLMIQPPNPVAIPQPEPIIVQPPTPEVQVQQIIQQPPPQQQVVVIRRESNNSSSSNSSRSSRSNSSR